MGAYKHLDLAELEGLAKGDQAFIRKMLESYCSQSPPFLEKLNNFLQNNDRENLRLAAHRLRPSFYYLGRADMAEILETIETTYDSMSDDELKTKTTLVLQQATLMLAEAREALQQENF